MSAYPISRPEKLVLVLLLCRVRFRDRREETPHLRFPGFVFVQKRVAESRLCIQSLRGGNQFGLGQSVEGRFHRSAKRAFFKTSDEGTPASPSTSICSARNELTVASSISSKRA